MFIPTAPQEKEPTHFGYRALKLAQAFLQDGLAFYTTSKTEARWKAEIIELLEAAGATEVRFTAGRLDDKWKRDAHRLRFIYEGLEREIVQAALPSHTATQTALNQAKRQALGHLYESLRLQLEDRHFQPATPAFMQYALPPGQTRTIAQLLTEQDLPLLAAGEVVEGELA